MSVLRVIFAPRKRYANIAGFYAAYHGPSGLTKIALRAHGHARTLAASLVAGGYKVLEQEFFDTISLELAKKKQDKIRITAEAAGFNFSTTPTARG